MPYSPHAVRKCFLPKQVKYYIHHITPEVLDGVLNHGEKGTPETLEAQVVKFADNVAYLSQDIEDLLSTKIMQASTFVGKASAPRLIYKRNGKRDERTWNEINEIEGIAKLNNAFSITRGKRIATFVERFVDYNPKRLEENSLKYTYSNILKTEIPQLECDDGLKYVINYLWDLIEGYYKDTLIATSNEIQTTKMIQLWEILNDKKFAKNNHYYKNFLETISNNTMFSEKSNDWKIAFFISNLSWQEVDLIIDSYHERNYNFDLDLT